MALRTSSMVVVVAASLTLVACSSNGEETTTVDTTPSTTVAPITTEASTTTVESTVAPTSGVTTVPPERPYSLWEEVAPPVLPVGHTTPFVESGELLDGAYWVDLNASTAQAPDVTVSQAFFGAECEEVAVQMGDECLNDVYVLSPPTMGLAYTRVSWRPLMDVTTRPLPPSSRNAAENESRPPTSSKAS